MNKPNNPKPRVQVPTAPVSELKAMLQEVTAEMEDLKQTAGGSLTEVMADWVAAQYLLAARKELAALPEGPVSSCCSR